MALIYCESQLNQHFDIKSQTSTQGDQNFDFQNTVHESFHYEEHYDQRGNKSKLKSSLCRNFTEKGFCPYGSKCQFAHGPSELKINLQTNTSYKTKQCHAFLKKGYCQYGYRCNFLHFEQINKCEDQAKKMKENFPQIIQEVKFYKGSRLLNLIKEQ